MSYQSALAALEQLGAELHTVPGEPRRKFRLEEMRTLAEALGNPQTSYPSVLIAGTNGKGSTAATLASILTTSGYRTGLYTSPHLHKVTERFKIDGETIPESEFGEAYERVHQAAVTLVATGQLPGMPSYFETVTAVAMEWFRRREVQIAVLEVGMGGRLDATNIVEPRVSVITDIALDHTQWLGDTIDLIAREKAGILRANGVMVTLPQTQAANQALGEVAVRLNVRGVNAADYVPTQTPEQQPSRHGFTVRILGEPTLIEPALEGAHQLRNTALAIATASELATEQGFTRITAQSIAQGIRATRWPGRIERFPFGQQREFVLDAGHNPAGAWTLRAWLSQHTTGAQAETAATRATVAATGTGPTYIVFGCLEDKALEEMTQILLPAFDFVALVPVHSPRAASMERLRQAATAVTDDFLVFEGVEQALAHYREHAPAGSTVVVTGSLYLIGEARRVLVDQQESLQLREAETEAQSILLSQIETTEP